MTDKSRLLKGKEGEDLAVRYLQRAGYQIVERNFRCRLGEIDIIARDGDTIVFLEVKTRTSASYGAPEAAVNQAKQKKISLVSLQYLQSRNILDVPVRFDVVALERSSAGHDIRLIRDAFDIDWQ